MHHFNGPATIARIAPSKVPEQQPPLQFAEVRVLGSGAYGSVTLNCLLERRPVQLFAIKTVGDGESSVLEQPMLYRERDVLQSLHGHPFITKLHGWFESQSSLNLVMEYCPGGDLTSLLSSMVRLPEHQLWFYAASIAHAIDYMHQRGIIHRDLKPDNILLDGDGFVRVADFGCAKDQVKASTSKCDSVCWYSHGQFDYMAPEMVQSHAQGYSYSVDLWGFGCILYELLSGRRPFETRHDDDSDAVLEKILHDEPDYPAEWSEVTRDFIKRLLAKDPSQRLGCGPTGMQELFDHDLLCDVDWRALWHKQVIPPYIPPVVENACIFDGPMELLSPRVDEFRPFEWCSASESRAGSPLNRFWGGMHMTWTRTLERLSSMVQRAKQIMQQLVGTCFRGNTEVVLQHSSAAGLC